MIDHLLRCSRLPFEARARVMGAGATTAVVCFKPPAFETDSRAARSRRLVGSVALPSSRSGLAWAVAIEPYNPRAMLLAKSTRSGVRKIDIFRRGSFARVRGTCSILPDRRAAAVRFAGRTPSWVSPFCMRRAGDELLLRILRELAAALGPGGRPPRVPGGLAAATARDVAAAIASARARVSSFESPPARSRRARISTNTWLLRRRRAHRPDE